MGSRLELYSASAVPCSRPAISRPQTRPRYSGSSISVLVQVLVFAPGCIVEVEFVKRQLVQGEGVLVLKFLGVVTGGLVHDRE